MPCKVCGLSGHIICNCPSPIINEWFEEIRDMYIRVASYYTVRNSSLIRQMDYNKRTCTGYYYELKHGDNSGYILNRREKWFRRNFGVGDVCHLSVTALRAVVVRYFPQPNVNTEGRLNKLKREHLVDILWDFFKDYDISDIDVEEINSKTYYKRINNFNVELKECATIKADDCPVCLENMLDDVFVSFDCCHQVCGGCLTEIIGTKDQLNICCPLCRANVTKFTAKTQQCYDSLDKFNYKIKCVKYHMD